MKLLLAAISLLILAGCNAELDQYRRAEVGKPLAGDGLLPNLPPPAEGLKADAHMDSVMWQVPAVAASRGVGVLVDARGNVVAKMYTDFALEHWLVAQAGAMDWRVELEVPAEYFHEAPTDSGRDVLSYLRQVLGEFDKPCQAQRKEGDQKWNLATGYPMVMFVMGRTTWPGSPQNHPADYRGLTKPGFERTIDFDDGGKATLRNLGGRRIQIEFKFFRIVDPVCVIPIIECMTHRPNVTATTSVAPQ